MASIYKRGRVWYFSYYNNGKRVRKRVGTSKKLVEIARKEVEVRQAKSELGWEEEIKDLPFHEIKEEYLKVAETNIRKTTLTRYKETLHHFTIFLDSKKFYLPKLSDITFQIIEEYKKD